MSRTLVAPLTVHHQKFVDAYMEMRVATQAAVAAGYNSNRGTDLLARPDVQAEINRRLAKIRKEVEITEANLAREMALIAFVDPGDMFDADGCLLPLCRMPGHMRRAVASYERDKDGCVKIRLHPKLQALEALGKYRGMFIERSIIAQSIQYVIRTPDLIPDSAEWAKTVHARVVQREKDGSPPS